jgi:AAA family ATP:ADP antiporter
MASDWSDTEVSLLWNLQFFISAGIVSAYGFCISRIRFQAVVPFVYDVFALSFFSFYLAVPLFADPTLTEKVFYVWVSTFSLFHVSVFWSFISDTFTKQQSKRLFSVIAAGGSLGAIVGPAIPALLAPKLGLESLMLIASMGLLFVIPLVFYIYHLKKTVLGNGELNSEMNAGLARAKLGGAWWSGFKDVLANRHLLGIATFILLYVFISSFVYFEQKNLLAEYSRPERAQILGSIDWIVNSLTFFLAFFVTSRLVEKLRMPATLALVPALMVFGMLMLAIAPLIVVVLGIQVARRTGNYAITRPAREMLFTQVSAEQRFKAKPVIDVVVYRGGDAVSGTLFALLSEGLGLGLLAISVVGAGIAALWAALGIRLGRNYEGQSHANFSTPESNTKPMLTTN